MPWSVRLKSEKKSRNSTATQETSGYRQHSENMAADQESIWLSRTKQFCYEASVVGLRYVVNASTSPLCRSVWVLLLIAGTAFTTFQIQDRIRYFLARPVSINLRIKHAEEMQFPTVTICNENRILSSAAEDIGNKTRVLNSLFSIIVCPMQCIALDRV